MALGAITLGPSCVFGNLVMVKEYELINFIPEDSYPTGGTLGFSALVQAALALIDHANDMRIIDVVAAEASGYKTEYLAGTDALAVYVSGGTEVANTTDLTPTGPWRLIVRAV
jgi:hypothetical protein